MALNPIVFTEKVVRSFLRYQLTAYAFADKRLQDQMRQLLSLDDTRDSPLLKGPFVSLSRPFRQGASVEELIAQGVFHPHMRQRIPAEITHVYGHQEQAIRSLHAGQTTLVSTGTGSGKSECFLYPVISRCLQLRDQQASPGISAVIVYPMNSLAEDQLGRLRSLLAGTGISFGMYVGKTPDDTAPGIRMPPGSSRADYEAKLAAFRAEQRSDTIYPAEEVCTREEMRRPGGQPRILLTNVKQLELLLTRQRDIELFAGARLDFLVFDEAHTFTGALGAETACLIRRLRAFCGRKTQDTVCVATSATIADKDNPNAALDFASRFFGVPGSTVTTVGEAYERETWATRLSVSPAPKTDPAELLEEIVKAVEDPSGTLVRAAWKRLTGKTLPEGEWTAVLYDALSTNKIAAQLADLLTTPTALAELPAQLQELVGRPVSELEVLAWLTLGAAARSGNRPLLRPVVHLFLRGISNAVVTFPAGQELKLWLAAEDEMHASGRTQSAGNGPQHAHFPVTTCTTCGQHYFLAHLKDFEYTKKRPGGGEATADASFWEPLAEAQDGHRVVLLDRIIGDSGDDNGDDEQEDYKRTTLLHFCRSCGAAHPQAGHRCQSCGVAGELVGLYAIQQKEDSQGHLTSCLSCGATGRKAGSYREPARPVRATTVADVHVLAQDMVHHSSRPRLLVFCDNRQDAAFQAGWMKDHARRFRLSSLLARGLEQGSVSVGDLARFVDEILEADEALSRALVPEVWLVQRREGGGGRHEQERRKFLRFLVLREVTLSARRAIGLEPWGRMKVDYKGLDAGLPYIQRTAAQLGVAPEVFRDGVAAVLDYLRRKRLLFDTDHQTFNRYWLDGDPEIQQGYLLQFGQPQGTKLQRDSHDDKKYVVQWLTDRGETVMQQIAKKWRVAEQDVHGFLERLFQFLVDTKLLKPVTLIGARGNPLPGASGVYQVDADLLRLQSYHGAYRCVSCRRRSTRPTPHNACLAWRCTGKLEWVAENPDDYNLQLLTEGYSMLRPEEHTAMVPHDERERLENLFKGESDAINTFVCTPTLELGVDIGQLDTVLMRNVPPLPANYWQRAGRAGRRHRMAVNITYCRGASHDRAYFNEPPKLLAGRVDPPAFNLRNELMVGKHVHATAITRLHQYARDPARSQAERSDIDATLRTCLPDRISAWLFDAGEVRTVPFDLSPLAKLVTSNLDDLCSYASAAFGQGWPLQDADVATDAELRRHLVEMVSGLHEILRRLNRRLKWAMDQTRRLNQVREKRGDLEPEDDALFRRCDALIKRLKGTARRGRREAEGYDDVNTFGVLAAEGFLPGYGLEVGSVLGTAQIPYWRNGAMDFTLPRAPGVALREYVPGNLIYANGNRFVARQFRPDADENRAEVPVFEVAIKRQAVKPTNLTAPSSSLESRLVQAISVCDVELSHQSHISDDEEVRFQLGVSIFGLERDQHNGGQAYGWGAQSLQLRRGVRFRLVNVGATSAIERSEQSGYGYPVCRSCGYSVSPLSSETQRNQFAERHKEHGYNPALPLGFYADVTADALSLPACPDQKTAYSVLEALRMAASQVPDMTMEDLQILVIGHVDRDEVDAILWDPMPGGSGLLDQICGRFSEVVAAAMAIVRDCPSACESSCIDCMQTFRNGFYHKHLHRKEAAEKLAAWGDQLKPAHAIPPMQPAQPPAEGTHPVNEAERRLRHLLLAAGFEEGIRGEQIRLDRAIGTTTPDVIYRAAH
ncbi:MAG: DEAD/DEAH box helicase, partial [Planctomycetaceae bacterium]